MLLETLDVSKNDVVIYSQNKFDFENNFKIIFKQEECRKVHKISFAEVSDFIRDPAPKNIIVYRLLTNVKELDSFSTKYGYFLNIKRHLELVYFDPVFAIKDLKHLRMNLDPEKFRFKIQQVGLSTTVTQSLDAVYHEVFSFDMKAEEAQHQNDKIFADAIFVFDETYPEGKAEERPAKTTNGTSLSVESIEETTDDTENGIEKVKADQSHSDEELKKKNIELLKSTFLQEKENGKKTSPASKNKRAFANFIEKHRVKIREAKLASETQTEPASGLELFKESESGQIKILRDESVVLKINDKEGE